MKTREGKVFHEVRSFLMQVVCKQCGTGIPHYNPVRKPGGLGFPRSGTWTVDLEVESNLMGKKIAIAKRFCSEGLPAITTAHVLLVMSQLENVQN